MSHLNIARKIALVLGAGILLGVSVACNKKLEKAPTNQSSDENNWKTFDDARAGLIGMYGLTRAALADNNGHWLWGELRNGDFTSYNRPDLRAIISGNLTAGYPVIETITNWRRFYAAINACNLFIENSAKALEDSRYTELNNRVDIAQARVIRAFLYFYMVRIWGDVPLITQSHEGSFREVARTSQERVLGFAQSEIEQSAPILPYSYGNNDPAMPGAVYYTVNNTFWRNTIFNKVSAYAVLAHITAWQGNYLETVSYTNFVLNNYQRIGVNYLSIDQLTGATGVFNNRGEGLSANAQMLAFAFQSDRGEATVDGHIEQLTLAQPLVSKLRPDMYITKDTLASMFRPSGGFDSRFGLDTVGLNQGLPTLYRAKYITNYSDQIPIFSKIKAINGGVVSQNDFKVFTSAILFTRLEEIALLKAEALAALGSNNTEAYALLNTVRSSRGLSTISATGGSDLLDEIFKERRRELAGEGWRWYDLVRYHKIKRNDPAFVTLINEGGIYWPIAAEVLSRNSLIVQNNYWKD